MLCTVHETERWNLNLEKNQSRKNNYHCQWYFSCLTIYSTCIVLFVDKSIGGARMNATHLRQQITDMIVCELYLKSFENILYVESSNFASMCICIWCACAGGRASEQADWIGTHAAASIYYTPAKSKYILPSLSLSLSMWLTLCVSVCVSNAF